MGLSAEKGYSEGKCVLWLCIQCEKKMAANLR